MREESRDWNYVCLKDQFKHEEKQIDKPGILFVPNGWEKRRAEFPQYMFFFLSLPKNLST